MWWYGYGWWWWWVAFVVIFFLLPLGYGWGYRGWGPWYRWRGRSRLDTGEGLPAGTGGDYGDGWGVLGIFMWLVLILAIIWLVAAWGGRW